MNTVNPGLTVDEMEMEVDDMAPRYAKIVTDIWDNEDFLLVPGMAQRFYMMLCTQKTLTPAGILTIALQRWAGKCPEDTPEDIESYLKVLADLHYILVDIDTNELWLRKYMEIDQQYRGSKTRPRVRQACLDVESRAIRQASLRTLDALVDAMGAAAAKPQVNTPSDGVSHGVSHTPSHGPSHARGARHPASSIQHPASSSKNKTPHPPASQVGTPPAKTGTRLPDDFPVTDSMKEWAKKNAPLVGQVDHDQFCDHFHSAAGPNSRKRNWVQAWQVWMRREQQTRGRRAKPAQLTEVNGQLLSDRSMDRLALIERAAERDRADEQLALGEGGS